MEQTAKFRMDHLVKWITVTAMLMAMNVALSSFGVPVPGGHFYLNDIVIVAAAILLDPLGAFMVGGVGAFLGDFFFYPAPMFVSLVTHGLQAVVISWLVRRVPEEKKLRTAVLAAALGAVINVVGYSLGRAFLYSTPEYALLKLPFQILQAGIGAALGVVLCWPCGIRKAFRRIFEA
jgi:uncharacterized membrane protein